MAADCGRRRTAPLPCQLTFACATKLLDNALLTAIGPDKRMPICRGTQFRDGRMIFGAGLVCSEPAVLERADLPRGNSRIALDRLQKQVPQLYLALREVRFEAPWA